MMNHNLLMAITAAMPMKTIQVNGEPYLERYFVGLQLDGTQIWLHRFLRNDSEEHLHSHPWSATSIMLCGWYQEELDSGVQAFRNMTGDVTEITPGRLHRIAAVEPNTWTMMVVRPERREFWHFIDNDGRKHMMAASPFTWFQGCGAREL